MDIQGALNAGYTHQEIADELNRRGEMDVNGARTAGYNDDEILKEYTSRNKPAVGEGGAAGVMNSVKAGLNLAKQTGGEIYDRYIGGGSDPTPSARPPDEPSLTTRFDQDPGKTFMDQNPSEPYMNTCDSIKGAAGAFTDATKAGLYRADAGLRQTGNRMLEYFGSDDPVRKEQELKAKAESQALDNALGPAKEAYPKSAWAGDMASEMIRTAPSMMVGGPALVTGAKALLQNQCKTLSGN